MRFLLLLLPETSQLESCGQLHSLAIVALELERTTRAMHRVVAHDGLWAGGEAQEVRKQRRNDLSGSRRRWIIKPRGHTYFSRLAT